MSKLSMVIPTYTMNMELEVLTGVAVATYRDQVDELIIVEDHGLYSPTLMQLADVYIYNNINGGFTKNVNRGWRYATGDYVAIVNSDTRLVSGNLRDLCIPEKVTSPIIVNQSIPNLAGPFFVVPKKVTKKRGMLLEEMHTYCSDSEYDHRVADIFRKVHSVKIFHETAKTVTVAGVEGGEQQEKDRIIYERLKLEGKAK